MPYLITAFGLLSIAFVWLSWRSHQRAANQREERVSRIRIKHELSAIELHRPNYIVRISHDDDSE